jgi:hypothetical protein
MRKKSRIAKSAANPKGVELEMNSINPLGKLSQFRGKRNVGVAVTILLIIGATINQGISRANSNTTFEYYIDAPLVQNSYLWTQFEGSPSTHLASFNNSPNNSNCTFDNFPGVSFSNNPGGRCFTDNSTNWGGSTTLSSNPSTGGYTNSTWDDKFMHGVISGTGATISFDEPQRYFGIWWTAGSQGNQLKFYSGDQIVGATSADDVFFRLSDPNSSFLSGGGNSFARDLYYGHPASYSPIEIDDWNQTSEITDLSLLENAANFSKGILDPNEPFTYIHFFTDNNVTFDRVVMSAPGNGFEFDNIVVSDEIDLLSSLDSRLIQQGTVLQPIEVVFDSNSSQGGAGNGFSRIEGNYTRLPDACPLWPNNCIYHESTAHFIGWNTEPDGSGAQYGTDQDEYGYQYYNSELASAIYDYSDSITLYAQWSDYFSFFTDQADWTANDFANVLHGQDLVLPLPTDRNGYTFTGWTVVDWENYDPVTNTYAQTFVGMPGDHITVSQYTSNGYYYFYESWTQGNTPTTNPAVLASPSIIPVDPRVNTAAIPSLPVDTAAFSLCVAEVTDSTGSQAVQSSDLSFATSPNASATGVINVSAPSPITGAGSRFVRITVADTSLQNCNPGNSLILELSPLELGGGNTVTVPIGRQ